jgi:hypothetical protein
MSANADLNQTLRSNRSGNRRATAGRIFEGVPAVTTENLSVDQYIMRLPMDRLGVTSPEKTDASINFDVWIHSVGQPPEEIEKKAVAEAVWVTKSSLAFCDQGI